VVVPVRDSKGSWQLLQLSWKTKQILIIKSSQQP